MNTFFMLLTILFLTIVIFKQTFKRNNNCSSKIYTYKYAKKDFFMTRAEHELFNILIKFVGNEYYIFPQVYLSTFLNHRIKGQSFRGALAHIDRKSVDFVLCDKDYIEPLLAIELDDKSHKKYYRKSRDAVVESILKNAGMPLLRIKNHGHFEDTHIKESIETALSSR